MPCSQGAERATFVTAVFNATRSARDGLLVAALCVLLGACSAGPGARLYVLDSSSLEGQGSEASLATATSEIAAPRVSALGVATITVPGYASDPRVVNRGSRNEVNIADRYRWAEEPEEAITRLLAERLRVRSGGVVLVEPWPRNFEPRARVELAFDRLLRDSSGGVEAAGQIRFLSGDGRDVVEVLSFDMIRPAESTATTDWFDAVARLVDELAGMAIDAISPTPV